MVKSSTQPFQTFVSNPGNWYMLEKSTASKCRLFMLVRTDIFDTFH